MDTLYAPISLCEIDIVAPEPVNLDLLYAEDSTVFKIPDVNLRGLHDRIDWLNKRADKLGAEPIAISDLEKTIVRDAETGKITHYTFVRVAGEPIRLSGGWTFAATLEHTEAGNIIRAVPGAEIPLRYRDADPVCDHCNLDRRRKDTYLVTANGLFMQVGRTCLKDFVGHRDPARIAAWLEYIAELSDYVENEFMGGTIQPTGIGADIFLGLTAASIRLWGWTSGTKKRETGRASTKDDTMSWLNAIERGRAEHPDYTLHDDSGDPITTRNGHLATTTPDDFDLGRAALNWARDLSEDDLGTSDYLYNLKVIAQLDGFIWRQTGLAASMIKAYQRYLGETLKRLNAADSQHVGEIKKRSMWTNLLCTDRYEWESQYGVTYLHKFTDADGNVIVWRTGTYFLEPGMTYEGKATVKAHDEYKGIKQTVITRFTWTELESPDGEGE